MTHGGIALRISGQLDSAHQRPLTAISQLQ